MANLAVGWNAKLDRGVRLQQFIDGLVHDSPPIEGDRDPPDEKGFFRRQDAIYVFFRSELRVGTHTGAVRSP